MTDRKSTFELVREFHLAFKQPLVESEASLEPIEERVNLRMDLIAEEFFELVEAVYGKASASMLEALWPQVKAADEKNRDIVETADALGDMVYVINGLALEANIDLDTVFAHIHESNMSKLDENGEVILSDGSTPDPRDGVVKPKGKILKSDKFWAPDIAKILGIKKRS